MKEILWWEYMPISQELFESLCKLNDEEFDSKFEFLGEGISRKVYNLNDKYVIKVAKDREGLYQNKVEHYVYTRINTKYISYLAKIACYTPRILIMQKAIPLTKDYKEKFINVFTFNNSKDLLDDLCFIADKYYLFYEDLISASSWGLINEKYVLIDYGCTSPFGDMFYEMEFFMNSKE